MCSGDSEIRVQGGRRPAGGQEAAGQAVLGRDRPHGGHSYVDPSLGVINAGIGFPGGGEAAHYVPLISDVISFRHLAESEQSLK